MTVDLIIAGYRMRLHSGEGVTIMPDERFASFIASSDGEPDLIITVSNGKASIPDSAARVFDAPLIEERPSGLKDSGETFWEVASDGETTYITAMLKDPVRKPLLVIPRKSMSWKLYTQMSGEAADPLPYPLDGLVLYFLTSMKGGLMLHGSGVICGGRGWIFTGKSGSGKTTMAMIFDRNGDRVIHDDRLIIRKEGDRWMMHSTPVYRNDEPRSAPVDHLWVISHGRSNISRPLAGAEAAGMIISNSVQQNWDRDAAGRLITLAEDLTSSVRVSRLAFLPDSSIRDYLSARESESYVTASQAAASLLAEEKRLLITAGGQSMWPVIRPGDRIILSPCNSMDYSIGDVVAIRRDGGFVVHRITEIKRDSAFILFRTRGDASMVSDPWITEMDLAGLVTSIRRGGKQLKISPRRVPYFIGWLLASVTFLSKWMVRGKS
ncbi:MAG: hypothetical protein L0Y37_02965 [Bacteroidales bacterium]|nr:hypothetical protein [Bacteroidales bacterium]